jgi:hypothetical protein
MVIGERRLKLPNGGRCFHGSNFGDVTHHVNVCKVDNVSQTTVKGKNISITVGSEKIG